MTKEKSKRVVEVLFAIYPNARGFGYAIIADTEEVLDYGIANFKEKTVKNYIKRFSQLLELYEPTVVILEDYKKNTNPKSKKTKKLIEAFKKECTKRFLKYKTYSREDIRTVFNHFNAKTKYEIALVLVRWKEELSICLPNKRKAWEPESYRMGIFDAFSLAMTYYYVEG